MQNPHFNLKTKIPKKRMKIHSTNHLHYLCAKKSSKKHQIIEKWDHFQYRLSCISPCKIFTLGQKLKFQKTCQNPFYNSFRVVLCKRRSRKTQKFEKWDHSKNRSPCNGSSSCEIRCLGQKLKFKKTCPHPFYKSFRVVLTTRKNTKYSRNRK